MAKKLTILGVLLVSLIIKTSWIVGVIATVTLFIAWSYIKTYNNKNLSSSCLVKD